MTRISTGLFIYACRQSNVYVAETGLSMSCANVIQLQERAQQVKCRREILMQDCFQWSPSKGVRCGRDGHQTMEAL